jgi:hypothetical protein
VPLLAGGEVGWWQRLKLKAQMVTGSNNKALGPFYRAEGEAELVVDGSEWRSSFLFGALVMEDKRGRRTEGGDIRLGRG